MCIAFKNAIQLVKPMGKILRRGLTALVIVSGSLFVLVIGYILLFTIQDGRSIGGVTKTFTGKVTDVSCSQGHASIILTVAGMDRPYRIHRGREQGISCDTIARKVLNKTVTVSNVAFFWGTHTGHINQLICGSDTVYNELK